jgi:hypothetical protein
MAAATPCRIREYKLAKTPTANAPRVLETWGLAANLMLLK